MSADLSNLPPFLLGVAVGCALTSVIYRFLLHPAPAPSAKEPGPLPPSLPAPTAPPANSPYAVLSSTLAFLSTPAFTSPPSTSTPVIEYRTPQSLKAILTGSSFSLSCPPLSSSPSGPAQLSSLLRLFHSLSVDTSHPLFVNQLISSLDPVSLAAELLSASLNASGYTYEIAPVASLVEEEVLKKLGGRCVRE